MAYSLMFGPSFYISVEKSLKRMSDEAWNEMIKEVFNCDPDFVDTDMVLRQIEKVNTCSNLTVPVEVWIDEEGYFTVDVFEDDDEP